MDTENYTFFDDVGLEIAMPDDGILSKPLFNNERMRITIFAMSAGQEMTDHTASTDAIVHILDGEIQLTVSGDVHTAKAGTWLRMAPHTPHSLVAVSAAKFYLIVLRK